MGFIYKVTNNINNKVYVGKSILNIHKRFKEHLNDSKNLKLQHRPLYNAMKKYGQENFYVELIEEVDNSILDDREKYWINYYRSYVGFEDCCGYNATLGGDGTQTKDYEIIVEDYLKTKSKIQTSKNLECCIETINRALESYHISTISKCAGRKVIRIDENNNEVVYESIQLAAQEIANTQNRDFQTVRKRINSVILHKQNQRAYGYYWKEAL